MQIDYSNANTPPEYICAHCGATRCKLWRESEVSGPPKLLCARCAAEDQEKDISDIGSDGKRTNEITGRRTDQIGWYVPAVPAKMGGYWSYSCVPRAGANWWKYLPTFPQE